MFDAKKLSDIELDKKILELNKKIDMTSNTEILNQLYNFLDELYSEQDERLVKESFDDTEGVVYDAEEDFENKTKGNSETPKQKEKAKSFMEKMPKIEPRWNSTAQKEKKDEEK